MGTQNRRATVYFDAELHKVLRLKSAETDSSVSELVNEAIRSSLAEDFEDVASFKEREDESDIPFSDVVQDLRRRGRL